MGEMPFEWQLKSIVLDGCSKGGRGRDEVLETRSSELRQSCKSQYGSCFVRERLQMPIFANDAGST